MTEIEVDTTEDRSRSRGGWKWPALVFTAAVVMGLPTLRGSFVGGDDHRLVLNHVLVNHPSPAHAIELFGMVHRDLYQPLPLLSFSLEFAFANTVGLFDRGLSGGAWLFHLTNIILHALNAALVCCVIMVMQRPCWTENPISVPPQVPRNTPYTGQQSVFGNHAVATIAAMLFAVHPLQVEVVAWVNGRMMLLSTLFALASLVALGEWLRGGKRRWAVLTAVFALCCAISKIRVALPLLILIVPLAQHRKIRRSFVVLWLVCLVVTGVFAYVNYAATAQAGMFEGAAEYLQGPRVVRALLALAWYFQHFVCPTGLASWYPTPALVRWSDPATLQALAVVGVTLALAAWSALRSRAAALGFAWFFVSIASTVQVVPTRNALAADRYMYLPIIGLLWVVGLGLVAIYRGAAERWTGGRVRIAGAVIAAAATIALTAMSWHTASFYETPLEKSKRIAELAATTPHVWERVAWACYRAERYEEAIAFAQKEFVHDDVNAHGVAHQAIGMSHLGLGRYDDAIMSLKRAVEVDPKNATAKYRLGVTWYERGRVDDGLPLIEQGVAEAPKKNPWIIHLARVYRTLGRSEDAGALYEQALQNNHYEVPATLGMAELAIEVGTREAYLEAERDLVKLLEWMPENARARVDLGVVYHGLGRTREAIDAYRDALEYDPSNAAAALNLAAIYNAAGDTRGADRLFELAASTGLESIEQLQAIHDFLIAQQAPKRAVTLWSEFLTRSPGALDGQAYLAWSHALAGDLERAKAEADALTEVDASQPVVPAALTYVALVRDEYDAAVTHAEALCATGDRGAEARRRLLGALATVVQRRPDLPWSFCLAARLYIADAQIDTARAFVDLCNDQCREGRCDRYAQSLRERLPGETPSDRRE
ncbi:MAG: tetratricopeptide repeat protein [Planctomycetota bacterium]